MKVRELIDALNKLPQDFEVVCGNRAIIDAQLVPAHYDGSFIKIKEQKGKIKEFEYVNTGKKVQLDTLGPIDIICDRGDSVFIEYCNIGDEALKNAYKKADEKEKQIAEKSFFHFEFLLFLNWVKETVAKTTGHDLDEQAIYAWAKKNIVAKMPIQKEFQHLTYFEARKAFWNENINVKYLGTSKVKISWKPKPNVMR